MRFAYATCQHRVETKRVTRVKSEGGAIVQRDTLQVGF